MDDYSCARLSNCYHWFCVGGQAASKGLGGVSQGRPRGKPERIKAINFDPTEEQRRWRDLAHEYAQAEIRPRAAQLDREQRFPYDIVAEMARLGLMGLTLPEEYGGSG